jgi:hypothetical protein
MPPNGTIGHIFTIAKECKSLATRKIGQIFITNNFIGYPHKAGQIERNFKAFWILVCRLKLVAFDLLDEAAIAIS